MALTDDDAYIPHLKEGVLRAVLIKLQLFFRQFADNIKQF